MALPLYLFRSSVAAFLLHSVLGEKSSHWDHHKVLDEDAMHHLYWTVQKDTIMFQLEFATTGWIGFGLSPEEGIAESDIFIGWVDGDKAMIYDYYAKDDNTLVLDKQQDLNLLSGKENKTHTIIRFSRKLDTCDLMDLPITKDSQHLIHAAYPKDPIKPNAVNFRQAEWMLSHVKFLNSKFNKIPMPDDVSIWDLRADNFTIPSNESTLYYCRIFRTPPMKSKHHIIKFTPVIRPQNMDTVHHILVFRCVTQDTKEAEAAVRYGGNKCFQPGTPSLFFQCHIFFALWAMGASPFVFPSHVGLPIGKETEYFMLEQHYHNPTFRSGIVDDSGIRFYYTPKLRPYDSAVFVVGTPPTITVTNVYPPGQKDFVGTGHAPPECLSQGMPEKGIRMFASALHTHELGRKIKLRHFRGNKELPPLAMDLQFRNHFQEYNFLSKDVRILPGDQLTVECSYDTRSRSIAAFNGLATTDEMCLAFVFHYMPLDVAFSYTFPPLELVAGLTGMNLSAANYTGSPEVGYPNPNYREYLEDYDWPDSQICLFQNAVRYSKLGLICYTNELTIIQQGSTAGYPKNLKPYIFPPNQCKGKSRWRQETELGAMCKYPYNRK